MGLSRQEYWSGLPWSPLGDPPDSGREPKSLMSPALAGGLLPLAPLGNAAGRFWLTSYLWGLILLRRTEFSGAVKNGSFSPRLAGSMRGFFSDIFYKRIVKFLEVHLTIWWGTYNRVPWGFHSQCHSHWANHPTIHEFQLRISCPCAGCCPGDSGTSCICASLQLWWQHLPVSPILRAKKNCWFFSVFTFHLLVWSGDSQDPSM